MISLKTGTSVGTAGEEVLLGAEGRTEPLYDSAKRASGNISVAAAVMLAGSAGQTSWITSNKPTEFDFVGKAAPATSALSTGVEPEVRLRGVASQEEGGFQIGKARSIKMKGTRVELTDSVTRLIRAPYVGQLLSSLNRIEAAIGEPRCAAHVQRVFDVIQTLSDVSPYDPFVRVLLAFYDSLAFENRWSAYSKEEYRQAYDILDHVAQRPFLNESGVGEAITALEMAGFSTLPFEIAVDAEEA